MTLGMWPRRDKVTEAVLGSLCAAHLAASCWSGSLAALAWEVVMLM